MGGSYDAATDERPLTCCEMLFGRGKADKTPLLPSKDVTKVPDGTKAGTKVPPEAPDTKHHVQPSDMSVAEKTYLQRQSEREQFRSKLKNTSLRDVVEEKEKAKSKKPHVSSSAGGTASIMGDTKRQLLENQETLGNISK